MGFKEVREFGWFQEAEVPKRAGNAAKGDRAVALSDYLREEILEEADLGYISQQERDRRLSVFDGSGPNGVAVLSAQNSGEKSEPQVPEDDPSISTARVSTKGEESDVFSYLAKPKEGKGLPAVLVIHENKGLTPHIEDVARRFAREGFVAAAPDLLSRKGGTSQFATPVDATTALKGISGNELDQDMMAVVSMLASDSAVDPERIGVVGFCFGGGMAWRLTTRDTRIKAAVPFYGVNPNLKYVPNITAKVLAIYGELDDRINAGIDEITEAMAKANKPFEKIIYPGAQHAFHNDANPDRYHPEAAKQAWQRTIEWLRRWMP